MNEQHDRNEIDFGIYIEAGELAAFAESASRLTPVRGRGSACAAVKELRRGFLAVKRARGELSRRYADAEKIPACAEWILDNFYMIEREYKSALADLSDAGELRQSEQGVLALELCRTLVRSGGCTVDASRCEQFLTGWQRVTVLERGELLAFPALLRTALILSAARLCEQTLAEPENEERAQLFSDIFASLRLLSLTKAEKLIGSADIVDGILAQDPSGDYVNMDSDTRRAYLVRLSELAAQEGAEEAVYARKIVKKALQEGKHVGFYLFSPPSPRRAALYIAANVLLTLFIALFAAFCLKSRLSLVLLLIPVSEVVKAVTDYILLRTVTPKAMPRMDTEKGIPQEGRTVCVISALITGADEAKALTKRLEELHLASRSEGDALCFGLLADLPAADSAETDEDPALLDPAREAIGQLNQKYGGGFYLFTRKREFDGSRFTARERKRGALLELSHLLCGEDNALTVIGDASALCGIRYILTLDSDTRIVPGSIGKLIGAALHPLCKPIIDRTRHIVTAGHAIIHPHISTDLADANATDFALIIAPGGGSDPYGSLCAELYMDAFADGGFAGKGLILASALLECSEAHIPDGCVLSHDAVEGAYLRGAYMGDAEFSDGFPSKLLPFYKRQHRWTRGDWQNLPWLFRRGRELSDVARWRIFDSVRRSLVAPMTFLAILAGLYIAGAGAMTAAWAAMAALLHDLFFSLADSSFSRREGARLRRYTRLLTGLGGAIVRTFLRLWLLPYEAWVNLSAALTALWRMLVSRKDLLQWQTAAQSGEDRGLPSYVRAMWFPMLTGVLLLFTSPMIIGRSAGLLWLLSPVMAAALSLPAQAETVLSRPDRAFLKRTAEQNLRYFTEFCTAEDNFLPPDNYQEQPPVGTAHRTSPTNIGLALVSSVAAVDMKLEDAGAAAEFIGRIVDTLEKMPRCMGHFYNWTDTRTLLPLAPAFVSTVDSGNLYACLLTVREALREWGGNALAQRIAAIMEGMDFSPLYDADRGLFHICYDAGKDCGAGGYYDLMASEAMLTSYIAIAKGDVPVKHWRALSRARLQKDGYRGLASWTGTMFEYLMPFLFLDLARGSLLYESTRFCVYVQRRRVDPAIPWGISESAFFSLDSALNYRYKAHGCAALALKRGQDAETVISPYSSYLALAVEPVNAVRNLRRLENMGACSRRGFIEAIDFTAGRCRRVSGEPVRCYMAHHVGMSIAAAANALCAGSIRRRFMADPAMSACSLLLQEKLPDSGAVLRRDGAEIPERSRQSGESWRSRGEDSGLHCALFSNGAYNIMSTNLGLCRAELGALRVYGYDLSEPLTLTIERGRESSTLLPAEKAELWELSEEEHVLKSSVGGLKSSVTTAVTAGEWGELRTVTIGSGEKCRVELVLRFEPVLAETDDYVNHQAFWRLGIEAEQDHNCLLLHRLRRGEHRELWLALACDRACTFSADRHGGLGSLSAPFVTARAALELLPDRADSVRFALCLGLTREEAKNGAARMLVTGEGDRGSMVSAAAALLGMSAGDIGAAMELLPSLLFSAPSGAAAKRDLWPYGISGDLPIICHSGSEDEAVELLKRFCLLKSCGVETELVYLTDELGEYRRPFAGKIADTLAAVGLEALTGSRGGVHFAPLSAKEAVISRAVIRDGEMLPPELPERKIFRRDGVVPEHYGGRAFEYYVNGKLPPRAWQLPLTNGSFGAMTADTGFAGMWYRNARETVLAAPLDVYAENGSEVLWLEEDGKHISLFAADDGYACRVSYEAGCAEWEKTLNGRRLCVTVFVPTGIDARVLILRGAAGERFGYALTPALGGCEALRVECFDGGMKAENAECRIEGLCLHALFSDSVETETDGRRFSASFIASDVSVIVLGVGEREEMKALCNPRNALDALELTRARLKELLGAVAVDSENEVVNNYVNYWCAYQAIICRLEARTSLYQSGGAYGFRDQLQDAVNLILLDPTPARERILDCCRHQYREGDVMHWWHAHPDGDSGIRSRCSDDLLWLVWGLCRYVETTGDTALCEEKEFYVNSMPLSDEESDRYETPEQSDECATVYEHAAAALRCCAGRGFGLHRLPLMGSGDWNDSLDACGGESVWLGWFLSCCALDFAMLGEKLCKQDSAEFRRLGEQVGAAAERTFNGQFYPRGFLPDGTVLGGAERVDSIAQSWAAFCPCADKAHAATAVDYALFRLIDRKHGLVKLFDPPFGADEPYVGYISSYGKGFRENGGQYTHAAIWLALACMEQEKNDAAWDVLKMLLPENADAVRYEAEPFVLAADVTAAAGHEGEAGWTWYTGSAAWYFRAVTEGVFGMELHGGSLKPHPHLPQTMQSCAARRRDRSGISHEIAYRNGRIVPGI